MLKYYPKDTSVTFSEFPDHIALCVNITNCPCLCECCSEAYLHEDIGEELTEQVIDKLIAEHKGITLFGFMGGDIDHNEVSRLSDYIHTKHNIKVGMYSGRDFIDLDLAYHLDCYKVGRWIQPTGNPSEYKNKSWGPLVWPVSNQVYYENIDNKLYNRTDKFRKQLINNWDRYIVKEE